MPRFEELKKIFKNLVQSSEDNSKSKQDGARLSQVTGMIKSITRD